MALGVQLNQTFPDREIEALVAFLEWLTGEFPMVAHPRLPRGGGA